MVICVTSNVIGWIPHYGIPNTRSILLLSCLWLWSWGTNWHWVKLSHISVNYKDKTADWIEILCITSGFRKTRGTLMLVNDHWPYKKMYFVCPMCKIGTQIPGVWCQVLIIIDLINTHSQYMAQGRGGRFPCYLAGTRNVRFSLDFGKSTKADKTFQAI